MRRQLPTHSPVTAHALAAGLAGALGRDDATNSITRRIRERFGARDVVLTGSGTDALRRALAAAAERGSGPIALPAYGCYDLATAAVGAGAQVVLYDLDPETLQPDAASLAAALDHRPRALVLVHLYGIPVDVEAVSAEARRHGVLVIEDAAQGIGAEVRGRPAGSYGSVSVLSFGRGKGLTGGAGGALLANDEAGEAILASTRIRAGGVPAGWLELAKTAAQWGLARPALYALPASLPFLRLGETVYHVPGEPRLMSRASMRVLDRVWDASHEVTSVRRRNAARLLAATGSGWRRIVAGHEATAGFLRLPLLPPNDDRARILGARAARLGVIQGYPLSLNALPGFRDRCLNHAAPMPGASLLARSLLTLPTHGLLSEDDLRALEAWLAQTAGRARSERRPTALV